MGLSFNRHNNASQGFSPLNLLMLSALAGLLIGVAQQTMAESGAGLVITKNGDKVNVNYDPASLPYFDTYRKDDNKTVIRVPKGSENLKLLIDPKLKKDNMVQETDTPRGKVITINSQQIYMISQDDLGEVTLDKSETSKPEAPARKAAETTRKEPAKPVASAKAETPRDTAKATVVQPVAKAENIPPVPGKPMSTETPPSLTSMNTRTTTVTPVSKPVNSASRTGTGTGISPVETSATLNAPVNMAVTGQPKTTNSNGTSSDSAVSRNESTTIPTAADRDTAPSNAEALLNSASPDSEPAIIESKILTEQTPADPESLPLDLSGQEQQAASQTSTGIMLRVTIGLVVVLAMLMGFMKLALPKLMERYPHFFENLKRRSQELAAKAPDTDRQPRVSILGIPRREPGTSRKPLKKSAADNGNGRHSSEKKYYLERMSLGSDHFQVLTSTDLGKGRELHLVEIRGRQLIVATTPYTVSLIKDLTDLDELHAMGEEPAISGLLASVPGEEAGLTDEVIETDDYYNPAEPKTEAYLEEHRPSPVNPAAASPVESFAGQPEAPVLNAAAQKEAPAETRVKPYASKSPVPKLENPVAPNVAETQPMAGNAVSISTPPKKADSNPLDSIYLKYLSPEEAEAERNRASGQQREVSKSLASFMDPQPFPTVDAEEVVVLEDYDDTYNG